MPRLGLRPRGGAASLATLLKNETRPYLWIDSGDWFQGTPEGNLSRGDAVIDVFKALKLTATVLGNHDFDYGQDNAQRLAEKLADGTNIPVLGSNIAASGGGSPGYIKPYVLNEVRKGVVIGIFGLITQDMTSLAFPRNIKGLSFGREADAAPAIVKELKSKGATIIIAATHMGLEEYDGKSTGIKEGDIFLAKNVPGIDLILGGHTHTELKQALTVAANGHQTLITQTSGHLSSVYQIILYVDPKTGGLGRVEAKLIRLDPAQYSPDPDMEKLVAGYQAMVAKEMGKPVGSSSVVMRRNAKGESVLGNWVTDVLKRYGKTDIGLINTFGVRADVPAGQLTYGDIYKVLPFDNLVVKVEIRGSELKKLVEQNIGSDVIWLQYSGVRIVYDQKAPAGQRLKSLSVGGAAVVDDKIYTITTMDFVATVDKAFSGIDRKVTEKTPILARDVLLKEVQENSPVADALDGRLKAANP